MNQAYVYKWTHIPSMKYYIGSRTAKNSHPNDGYICSSREVKPMIVEHPDEWVRTIVAVGSPEEMYKLETEILQLFDCQHDIKSFNKHNNYGKVTGATYGMLGKTHSEESNKKRSLSLMGHTSSLKGVKRPRLAALLSGKPKSEEHKAKMRKPKVKSPCPHCGLMCAPNTLSRFHGENCKHK